EPPRHTGDAVSDTGDGLQRRRAEPSHRLRTVERSIDDVNEKLHQRGAVPRHPVSGATDLILERSSKRALDAVRGDTDVAIRRLDLGGGVVAHRRKGTVSRTRSTLDAAQSLGHSVEVERVQGGPEILTGATEQCRDDGL